MRFLYNNLAVICIATVVSLTAWLFGGTRDDVMIQVMPWVLLILGEVALCFPQRHRDETDYDARDRAWRSMKRDPLVWTCLGLLALLAIPFVNNGLCPTCDAVEIAKEGARSEPLVPFLPFCVNRIHHLGVFLWFAVALSCVIATKHCLCRRGKRMLLEMIVWNGFALAILGFVQVVTKAPGPFWIALAEDGKKAGDFFSAWGYPNMAGDYFTTLFGLSVGLWRDHYDRKLEEISQAHGGHSNIPRDIFWKQNLYLVPAVLFFFAAQNTLSRAAIILVASLAGIFFVHTFICFAARMHRVARVKAGAITILVAGVICFCAVNFMPEKIEREVKTLGSNEMLDRVTGKGQYHIRVATALWRDHLLFGCGGWGYRHLCLQKMTEEEKKGLQVVGGANVHNDHMQFLAEHGLVGFGALFAIFLMLLHPFCVHWSASVRGLRFVTGKARPPRPVQIFVVPAPVFCVLCTTTATIIHAFGDCPLRSPAVLSLFFVSLAAMYGYIPKLAQSDGGQHHHHHHHHH